MGAKAVAAAREVLDPTQQVLPDELTAALEAARAAWERSESAAAAQHLATALTLAHDLDFF